MNARLRALCGLLLAAMPVLAPHVQGATNRNNSADLCDYDFDIEDAPPAVVVCCAVRVCAFERGAWYV